MNFPLGPVPIEGRETSDKRIAAALRQMIMAGKLAEGTRLSEVQVAEMFAVSRTPARLALTALEIEGLIKKRDGRGYTIQQFSFDDFARVYEVRGMLEGLAAATMAREGMDPELMAHLLAENKRMEEVIANEPCAETVVTEYQKTNTEFHENIMQHCGNRFVGLSFARLENLPMGKLGTLVFNEDRAAKEVMRLRLGNMQHRVILDAIEKRDTLRAEMLMREHGQQIPLYSTLFV